MERIPRANVPGEGCACKIDRSAKVNEREMVGNMGRGEQGWHQNLQGSAIDLSRNCLQNHKATLCEASLPCGTPDK